MSSFLETTSRVVRSRMHLSDLERPLRWRRRSSSTALWWKMPQLVFTLPRMTAGKPQLLKIVRFADAHPVAADPGRDLGPGREDAGLGQDLGIAGTIVGAPGLPEDALLEILAAGKTPVKLAMLIYTWFIACSWIGIAS